MNAEQTTKLLDWIKDLVLKFEDLFHRIQAWFDNDSWMQRIVTEEETTAAE